jgi:chaperonin cofactor prefoldin
MTKLKEEQLNQIKSLKEAHTSLRFRLADIEIEKHVVINQIKDVAKEFKEIEKAIIEEYGKDATLNLQTGEISNSEKSE